MALDSEKFHSNYVNYVKDPVFKSGGSVFGSAIYLTPFSNISYRFSKPLFNNYNASVIGDVMVMALCQVAKVSKLVER